MTDEDITKSDRSVIQKELEITNPEWTRHSHYSNSLSIVGQEIKTNPDGDVDLGETSYESFNLPTCPHCSSKTLKPAVKKNNPISLFFCSPLLYTDKVWYGVLFRSRSLVNLWIDKPKQKPKPSLKKLQVYSC